MSCVNRVVRNIARRLGKVIADADEAVGVGSGIIVRTSILAFDRERLV